MFSCTNGEVVVGEVLGIDLGNATFKFEDAGIAGFDDFFFGGNGIFEFSYASVLLCQTFCHFNFLFL